MVNKTMHHLGVQMKRGLSGLVDLYSTAVCQGVWMDNKK